MGSALAVVALSKEPWKRTSRNRPNSSTSAVNFDKFGRTQGKHRGWRRFRGGFRGFHTFAFADFAVERLATNGPGFRLFRESGEFPLHFLSASFELIAIEILWNVDF